MRISSITIENYRAVQRQKVELGDLTAFVGANGAGKSTVLKALDLFYATKAPAIAPDDFFNRNTNKPISKTVEYRDFSADEQREFQSKIKDGKMAVTRMFFSSDSDRHGLYQTSSLQHRGFDEVRKSGKVGDKRSAYNALLNDSRYAGSLERASTAADIEAQLVGWELSNPQACEMGLDGGSFFGLKAVAQNKLTQRSKWIYIPAVKDASSETGTAKGSAIGQLVDLVVRSKFEGRKEYREFRARFEEQYAELTSVENNPGLVRLQDDLSLHLKSFYPTANLGLELGFGSSLQLPPPVHNLSISDEGFETSVDRMGHGLQRALVMALAQQLALTPEQVMDEDASEEVRPDDEQTLILAIEEPEIYQHPAKQRHFYKVLQNLSQNGVSGTGSKVQVLYTTHSPLLLSVERFDEIRIVKRDNNADDVSCSVSSSSSADDVCKIMKHAKNEDSVIDESFVRKVKSSLHTMEGYVSEGFFARAVVLVEGKSDQAILEVVAQKFGKDLGAKDISILSLGSKGNFLKTAAVFQAFSIPIFLLWDGDGGDQENANLLRFSGVPEHLIDVNEERVSEFYACFRGDLEKQVSSQLGEEKYAAYKQEAFEFFDVKAREAMKRPAVANWIFDKAYSDGASFPFVEEIVNKIYELV
ncbi:MULTISPECIES: ATP-dependent nuclease [unclassified Thalassospira]|uniref:ATP-dependent nuclease n=1 Tax=unclassified Thalassospira TaxID=2648997 RepID=UPI0025CD751A|nr:MULTISPECIES: ATP-dependent endonuclease [unclassified Thalassospira]|tara:strand:- start:5453 stop:7384 length:1932 start_codon:yes stop_codon:yes gene_type:complete